jgi:hypothetical protein
VTPIDPKKQARVEEVNRLLADFAGQYLADAPDIASYVSKLWAQIARKRNFIITGGAPEVWAAAAVYVIARLNFLFDKSSPHCLPPDTICGHFGTRKNTVSARATQIEKACRIRMGQEGLCSPDISDSLTFVRLSNGMIVSKRMARRMGILSN